MADYTIQINAKDNTKKTFSNIESGLGGLAAGAGRFKAALGAAGAAFAAFGVGAKVKGAIDDFDNLAKSARAAGATASGEAFRGFQVLQTAMGEAGIDAGTFDRAMLNTVQRLQKGTEGAKGFSEVVDKLGPGIKTANGELREGPELLKAMINGLNEGKISTDEFAKVVGGRAGPLIQQQFASLQAGAEGLEATLADVEKHANIVPLDAAERAEVFNDSIGRLQMAFGKMGTEIVSNLLPHLQPMIDNLLANAPAIVAGVTEAFEKLRPVFSLIGTLLTEVVAPVLSTVFDVLGFIAEAINPLVDSALPGLKNAFEGMVAIVESIVGFFSGVAETLGNIYDKAMLLKDGVTGSFDSMADSVSEKAKTMTDNVTGWFDDMYMAVVGGSIVPDMVDGVIAEFVRQQQAVEATSYNTTNAVTEDFQNLASTIEQDFVGTLESALSDGKLELNDFQGFFANTITNLITDAIRGGNGIGNAFGGIGSMFGGGGGGGFFSNIFSGFGSIFGGFFADGGRLGAGKVGIVGEAGPELISGPANITPMDDVNMSSGGAPVTININAIDTQTGTQFLLDNKAQIQDIIQRAYNRRGKPGIV